MNVYIPLIEVMLLGIVIEVRLLQSLNAYSPIEVTPSGMVTEVRLWQRWNAYSPIEVTLSGIMVVEQPAIRVLELVSIIALHLLRES